MIQDIFLKARKGKTEKQPSHEKNVLQTCNKAYSEAETIRTPRELIS